MSRNEIFANDYREFPYWWEAYEPGGGDLEDVPGETRVAIIGAGYAGLATALELSRLGIEATVIDANDPGYGASTRSGGLVVGTHAVKKPMISAAPDAGRADGMMRDAADGFALLQRLIDEEDIECGWRKTGRFQGAWSKAHFTEFEATAQRLNRLCDAGVHVVPPARQRDDIGSDFYHGGMVTEEAAHLHPALYFKGLFDACRRRGVTMCARAEVLSLTESGAGWEVATSRGVVRAGDVVVATNGYTGDATPQFKRRLISLRPYVITTEPLPADLAGSLSPKNRSFTDTRRIVAFFRMSSDGRRLVYGSRVKWRDITPTEMAPLLYKQMTDRFPQLKGTKVSHAWTGQVALTLDEQPHVGVLDGLHYALGCNGSGVVMMTYLGTQLARKIAGAANYACAFDGAEFPTHPLYTGNARWYLPMMGNFLRLRDWIDRKRSGPA